MSVVYERTRSCWMDVDPVAAPTLDRSERADVVVIGAGIAGLSVAYELVCKGRSVVVLDRGPVARGMTSRTTAHLASELDDFYHALIDLRGLDPARGHYESQAAAISRIEEVQAAEGIACDFKRVDSYLFAAQADDGKLLEQEFAAARRVGMSVDWAARAPVSGADTGQCLRFAMQGRVHPLKYLNGLAAAVQRRGGRLYGDTTATAVEEDERGVRVATTVGHEVTANAAVVATYAPINDRLAVLSKQAPYRTYVIAGPVRAGSVADALYWDTHDPYHYVRLQPNGGHDLLIVGGEDHRTGEHDDGTQRFQALESWARRLFPELGEVTHRWSGQVQEPVDYCGFIGLKPGNERTYLATGDSGQGITTGVVASLLLAALIVDGRSPWQELYDPARKPLGAAAEFMRENMAVVKNFTEYLTGGDVSSVQELAPGEGAVVRRGLKKIAAYRDEAGTLHQHSAVCPHSGCIVHWNGTEQCWDCPCHGSHFAADGKTLNAPAISPLEPVQD